MKADETCGDRPSSVEDDGQPPPSGALISHSVAHNLKLLTQALLKGANLEKLLDIARYKSIFKVHVINLDYVSVSSKRPSNKLKLMIVHFDFLDQVISFLLHIGHQLFEENPFIVNP